MSNIPDFKATMSDYTKLDVESLVGGRRTEEDPVRMSIYDVIQVVTVHTPSNCKNIWDRLVSS